MLNSKHLPSNAISMFWQLAGYLDSQGNCFPSYKRLADDAGIDRRTAMRAIKKLEESGVLIIGKKYIPSEKEPRVSNQYRLCSGIIGDNPDTTISDKIDTNKEVLVTNLTPLMVTNLTGIGDKIVTLTDTNNGSHKNGINDQILHNDFDQFWKVYPRKVGKTAAYSLYKKLRKRGIPVEDLERAAVNYAAEQRETEQNFIKHAATFLGPKCHYQDYISGAPEEETELARSIRETNERLSRQEAER